jgi:glutamine amidotransferase
MGKVCILDYGSGNVRSVLNSTLKLEFDAVISNSTKDIQNASHLILPGVGSYRKAVEKVFEKIPLDLLREQVRSGKPILGICVGMQIFSNLGQEFGESAGLGFIPDSEVGELDTHLIKPHMGWNSVKQKVKHQLFSKIPNESDFYFVHSFAYSKIANDYVVGTTDYGTSFPSIIANENIVGTQFHPEKSQQYGLALLGNFLRWNP